MAIGLSDITKNKSSSKPAPKEFVFEKEKALRPWETYDTTETKTRTLRAQEAVRKAQAIVKRNELYTMELPRVMKSQALEDNYEEALRKNQVVREHQKLPVEKYKKNRFVMLMRFLCQTIVNKKNA